MVGDSTQPLATPFPGDSAASRFAPGHTRSPHMLCPGPCFTDSAAVQDDGKTQNQNRTAVFASGVHHSNPAEALIARGGDGPRASTAEVYKADTA